MKGLIFDIKRFAIHDGPGIRATLFTKGCALSCPWCHNPEGLELEQRLVWNRTICIGCGECLSGCPEGALSEIDKRIEVDTHKCCKCGVCVDICPSLALTMDSSWKTPEEVVEELLRDFDFFDTSLGGVTISGGEPFFQFKFNREVLKICGERGIHRSVETALFAPLGQVKSFADEIDCFLCDLKIADPGEHLRLLKVPQEGIIANLNYLIGVSKDISLRIPLIPGFTATAQNLIGLAGIIRSLGKELPVELLNFNPLAENKYRSLNIYWPVPDRKRPYSPEEMEGFRQIMKDHGIYQVK